MLNVVAMIWTSRAGPRLKASAYRVQIQINRDRNGEFNRVTIGNPGVDVVTQALSGLLRTRLRRVLSHIER